MLRLRCPRCGSSEEFEKTLTVVQVFDGRADMLGQGEKDCPANDPPSMECSACGHLGNAADFSVDNQTCDTCILAEDHCAADAKGPCDRWKGLCT